MSNSLAKFHQALAAAGIPHTVVAAGADEGLAHELATTLRWKTSMRKHGDQLVAHLKKTADKPDFDAEKYAQFLAKTWMPKAALSYYKNDKDEMARYFNKETALEAGRIFVEYVQNGEYDEKSATASATLADPLTALAKALASSGIPHLMVGGRALANAEKRIRVSYEVWNEAALDAGDTDEKGWENEEGIDFTTDEDPIAEAVRYLQHEGATEFSSSSFDSRGWYQSSDAGNSRNNMETGEETIRSFHLNEGWTDEEKEAIYNAVMGKIATAAHIAVAFGATSLSDAIMNKINSGKPFKNSNGSLNGSLVFPGQGRAYGEGVDVIDGLKEKGADYWLCSYQTPIAARVGSTWFKIPGKYSPTTSRHQGGIYSQLRAVDFGEGVEAAPVAPVAPKAIPGALDLD